MKKNRHRRKCLGCRRKFHDDPRTQDRQRFCSKPACKKASKAWRQAHWPVSTRNCVGCCHHEWGACDRMKPQTPSSNQSSESNRIEAGGNYSPTEACSIFSSPSPTKNRASARSLAISDLREGIFPVCRACRSTPRTPVWARPNSRALRRAADSSSRINDALSSSARASAAASSASKAEAR